MNKMQDGVRVKTMPVTQPEVPDNSEAQKSALEKLLRIVGYTQDVELSCDEVEKMLDQFAELAQRGEDVKEIMPLVKNHVDLCPECREEFEALMRILQHTG
jgi:hypothetical protein